MLTRAGIGVAMLARIQGIAAVTIAALAWASAQEPDAAVPAPEQARWQELQFDNSSLRQPGWVENGAQPAAGKLTPEPSQTRRDISPSAPEIRQFVAKVTDLALSPDGLAKALDQVPTKHKQVSQEQRKHYDELTQQLRAQFKARYGEDFELAGHLPVLAEYRVLRGLHAPDEAMMVASRDEGSAASTGQKTSLQEQRHATLIIPPNAELNQPALTLMFSNANPANVDWHLMPPDTLTAERFAENMQKRLARMLDGQAKWPADARDAYRVVTYNVMAALIDQPQDRPREPTPTPRPTDPDNPSLES